MTRKTFFKSLIMAGILPLCAFANDGGVTKEEKQDIEFVNNNGDALNDKTLQVPLPPRDAFDRSVLSCTGQKLLTTLK